MNVLQIKTKIQIARPTEAVFEAIIDPVGMSNYFISKSSGRMEAGANLIWKFPEFDVDVPIEVKEIELNKYISFLWDGSDTGKTLVEINLSAEKNNSTVVTIIEGEMENNEVGIKWLKQNTEGWANFLACLKAYLEYNINLRNGAFDFMGN